MRYGVCGLMALALSTVISAQSPEVEPRFEVVSVKASDPNAQGGRLTGNAPGTFRVDNFALRDIILSAYAIKDYQLVNAPEWTRGMRFDIIAKYPEGADPATQRLPMLRNVLRDRFKMVARRETRDMPMLRLVMARSDRRLGPQLSVHDLDCPRWFAEKRPQVGAGGKSVVTPNGTRLACAMMGGRDYLTGSSQTMAALAGTLSNIVGLPVTDSTGLTGAFDMDLKWTPADAPANDASGDVGGVLTALQDQLGLKLESARGPGEVLVIEHVERPTPD